MRGFWGFHNHQGEISDLMHLFSFFSGHNFFFFEMGGGGGGQIPKPNFYEGGMGHFIFAALLVYGTRNSVLIVAAQNQEIGWHYSKAS
jgi:hypothetical protein